MSRTYLQGNSETIPAPWPFTGKAAALDNNTAVSDFYADARYEDAHGTRDSWLFFPVSIMPGAGCKMSDVGCPQKERSLDDNIPLY